MSWKKCDRNAAIQLLTPQQKKIVLNNGTEKAFTGSSWNNKASGIYVDLICGEPLFSSKDKYDSGTGWPSFTKPISEEYLVKKIDKKLFRTRIEIRSRFGDAHLGHVFDDGPQPTGQRYCMNSEAMRFIPKDKMKEEGYADYLKYVE